MTRAIAGFGKVRALTQEGDSVVEGINRKVRDRILQGYEEGKEINAETGRYELVPSVRDWSEVEGIVDTEIAELEENGYYRYSDLKATFGAEGIRKLCLARLRFENEMINDILPEPESHTEHAIGERIRCEAERYEEWRENEKRKDAEKMEELAPVHKRIAELKWTRRLGDKKIAESLREDGFNWDESRIYSTTMRYSKGYGPIARDVVLNGEVKMVRTFVKNVIRKGYNGPEKVAERLYVKEEMAGHIWDAMVALA